MHYIRFLKTPRVYVDHGAVFIRAVIVVTTDLGETFYPESLELVASLRDIEQHGDIYLRRKVQWTAGARALPVSFNISHQDIDWPAGLHVAVRNLGSSDHGFLPPIVDVWSGPVNPTKGHMDSGRLVERRFTSCAERSVSLLEEAGDSIARHIWDGSQVLAQHIDQTISLRSSSSLPLLEYTLTSATYRKLTVLELGCGCGTVGISLAQAVPDCDVLLTDLPDVAELIEANILRMKPAMSSKAEFLPLDWEEELPERVKHRTNDLIVVSECTYNTDTLQPLVNTLIALVDKSPQAVIVVSTKTRHESEAAFFGMMKHAGLVEGGNTRISLPGITGNGYGDWAKDVGLHLFHGRDHRPTPSPRRSGHEVPSLRKAKAKRSQ